MRLSKVGTCTVRLHCTFSTAQERAPVHALPISDVFMQALQWKPPCLVQTGGTGPPQAFAEEFFYAWQYERPASPWLFALSALLVVVVMALCLFPLAPHWCPPSALSLSCLQRVGLTG